MKTCPLYTYTQNLKVLNKMFLKLLHIKSNLYGKKATWPMLKGQPRPWKKSFKRRYTSICNIHVYLWGHLAFCAWSGPKCSQRPRFWPLSGLYWPICWRSRPKFKLAGDVPIYTHILNFKGPRQILMEVERGKENLCSVTGPNPKYPQHCLEIQ